MNRRDFLQPTRLASVAGPLLALAEDAAQKGPSSAPLHLRLARRAMATTFEVIVPFGAADLTEMAEAAFDEIDRLEAQLTVFRETSEVSRLNARAAQGSVRVERNLFELLSLAQRIHRDTEGAFDISVGALIKTWGFFRRAGRVPTPPERAAVRERIGMQHVVLDDPKQSVAFQRQGLEINLGSIGKGYALDCAARHIGMPSFLLHGGHSSVLARGIESPNARGWTIGLTDPRRPDCRRALLHLRNRAMATSAATFQHLEYEGKRLGHLLDPRTAWPAEGILSATATAPTAAEADAMATAFFILGIEKTRAYCELHPQVGAVLIAEDSPNRMVILGMANQETEILR